MRGDYSCGTHRYGNDQADSNSCKYSESGLFVMLGGEQPGVLKCPVRCTMVSHGRDTRQSAHGWLVLKGKKYLRQR